MLLSAFRCRSRLLLVFVSLFSSFLVVPIAFTYLSTSTSPQTGHEELNGDQSYFRQYWHGFLVAFSSNDITKYPQSGSLSSSVKIDESLAWGDDPGSPTTGDDSPINVRLDHPRLFASKHRWKRLPKLITKDAYLFNWNKTIFEKALEWYGLLPVNYTIDGVFMGNGVLDVARTMQLRIKHWAYSYRLSHDYKWVDRTWEELVVASGNSSKYFGIVGDNWNTQHWLDVGEFLTTFAFAYDWLYEAWNSSQRDAIMWSIITLGLQKGLEAYDGDAWFLFVNGNWNCVSNGGIIAGSLAIYHEDPTGIAAELLPLAISNAQKNCAQAVLADGSWSETPDYWYFGTQSHAQMASALLTATGTTRKMLTVNPAWKHTGHYHMYASGMTETFNFGDCGPEKITATANSLLFYGDQFKIPQYILFQRDRPDASDPLSIFWYNPQVTGDWFSDLPLDQNFPTASSGWVSMRSSWTDANGLYIAMKGGTIVGHQTHGNIDAGDFVLDALGERWASELCQNNYLSPKYFSSEAQDSDRWLYYRCRTEGQNTILYNSSNQRVDATPTITFAATNDVQTFLDYPDNSTSCAYWIVDLTNAYGGTDIKRGLRILDQRTQVLIQDEITNATAKSQWRMHTNASVTLSSGNRVAHLTLNSKTMIARLQSPPTASFHVLQPVRLGTDPVLPEGATDDPNIGVTVLAIDIPAATQTVAVMFSPQQSTDQTDKYPTVVPLKDWTLSSHLELHQELR